MSGATVVKLPVVAFKAHLSGDYTISSGSYQTVHFDVDDYNYGNMFSKSNYKVVAPVHGIYLFSVTIRINTSSSNGYAAYSINGGTQKRLYQKGSNIWDASFQIELFASDTLEIQVYSYDETTIAGSDEWTRFSGSLLYQI